MKKNRQLMIALVGVLGLILITVGVTYAWFSYLRTGTKDNIITTGKINFLYTEVDGVGAGIKLVDAMPMTDEEGKAQRGINGYFDFKVEANTGSSFSIPYTVTARVNSTGDNVLDPKVVKVWLSDQNDVEIEPVRYFDADDASSRTDVLQKYTGVSYASNYNERVLYTGTVPANSTTKYVKDFRLRIWIDIDTDFSPVTTTTDAYCTQNTDGSTVTTISDNPATSENCVAEAGYTWHEAVTDTIYPYNNKEFTVTVNVYANGEMVSEDITYDASEISYSNALSTACTSAEDQTVECALNELSSKLGS